MEAITKQSRREWEGAARALEAWADELERAAEKLAEELEEWGRCETLGWGLCEPCPLRQPGIEYACGRREIIGRLEMLAKCARGRARWIRFWIAERGGEEGEPSDLLELPPPPPRDADEIPLGEGWRLTCRHARSSYGIPVLVSPEGEAYGPADILPGRPPLEWWRESAAAFVLDRLDAIGIYWAAEPAIAERFLQVGERARLHPGERAHRL